MEFIKNLKPIIICDIGASPIDSDNFINELFNNATSKIIGFEPNINEFNKLKNTTRKKYFNFPLGDGKIHKLNICFGPGMSSFLEPNYDYLKLFHGFKKWAEIIEKKQIKTKKLDDLNLDIDVFKIDVQGFESKIIEFGKNTIKKSLVVQIEISPTPIYKKEKSFSFVSQQLEKLGFRLHMFNNINSRAFKPMIINNNIYDGLNHLFQLDCVFIKNFNEIDNYNIENLKKLILILFYGFKSYDLVDYLIIKLDKLTNSAFIEEYRKLIQTTKILKKY